MDRSKRNSLSNVIYDCIREVHSIVGPGILSEVFKYCLAHEFRLRNMSYRMNYPMAIQYKGIRLEEKTIADFIVEEEIVLEIVSGKRFYDIHLMKLHTLLFVSGLSMGILINPNEIQIIDGFKKIINPKKLTV